MFENKKIFVAGHRGLVGSAILRSLENENYKRIVTRPRGELDLTVQIAVEEFFAAEKPEIVFLAAGKVGGICANDNFPADFIRDNLLIQTNVIDAARRHNVERFLFFGSSCIYPKNAAQPLREEYLLTSALEPTNEAYAVAKIAGIKMCQAYNRQYGFDCVCLMPTNLYGENDSFDLQNSHVLPALIRKFHEAKTRGEGSVEIWGTGAPRREFLHAEDLASAAILLMRQPREIISGNAPDLIINVGASEDLSILELAEMVKQVVGFQGELKFDAAKPDGTPRKLLDISRLKKFGWTPRIELREGVARTYEWYKNLARREVASIK